MLVWLESPNNRTIIMRYGWVLMWISLCGRRASTQGISRGGSFRGVLDWMDSESLRPALSSVAGVREVSGSRRAGVVFSVGGA